MSEKDDTYDVVGEAHDGDKLEKAALDPDKEKLEAVARGIQGVWNKLDLGLTSEEAQGVFVAAEAVIKEAIRILRSVK